MFKKTAHSIVNTDKVFEETQGFGIWLSDKVADFGGSWKFIILFLSTMAIWIIINTVVYFKHYDPYPFILLNLILSCIAALQAPIIMMSQNRQEEKDRLRAENDYQVNVRSEKEIQEIHCKINYIIQELENLKNKESSK
jgi:uncharacterized membrane protein